MDKGRKIGGISFSEEGYNKFVSLTKEKQLEKVYNSLNPKDMEQAELALKNVPNGGDIGKGVSKEDGTAVTKDTARDGSNNTTKPKADKS